MINEFRRLLPAARLCLALAAVCCRPAHADQPVDARTLRVAFSVAETAFDPVVVSDVYSNSILEAIVEPLLSYDYLARPVRLVPNTAAEVPTGESGGTVYTFHIKPGIVFADDPAFRGRRHELTAADYAYSIKRLFDPKLRSPWLFLLEGKIVGLDALMKQARDSGRPFDYDAPVAGIETPDRYTLRLRLTAPDYNLLYIFAMPTLAALAREVVEFYGADIGAHPVGTGPYRLVSWVRSSRMVLEASPSFREEHFAAQPSPGDAADAAIVARMLGRRLPAVGRVEVSVIEEDQPRYLAFRNGDLDLLTVPSEFIPVAVPGGRLAPDLARRGVALSRMAEPDTTYVYFNMEDPVVGGYEREKVALRRAVSLAYDTRSEISILYKDQAIAAQSPIPPGVAGYDAALRNPATEYDPAKARALLDVFGYRDVDGDGYRERPDGRPLVLEIASTASNRDRQFDELWQRSMDAIGIRIRFHKAKWPDLLKESKLGKLQIKGSAWVADYPDADNFLQLLYGPNAGQANDARFRLPAYDRLYEQAKSMPDSPERNRLYREMTRLVTAYAPWKLGVHRVATTLVQPWVGGFKAHPILHAPWKYLEVTRPQTEASR